jgi:hypothetical protein
MSTECKVVGTCPNCDQLVVVTGVADPSMHEARMIAWGKWAAYCLMTGFTGIILAGCAYGITEILVHLP